MGDHKVQLTHVRHMVEQAQKLLEICDGTNEPTIDVPLQMVNYDIGKNGVQRPTIDVLDKVINNLRHAAEEVQAERLSVLGWRQ